MMEESLSPREQNLLEEIRSMDPEEFEHLVADVYRAEGYDVNVTQASRDRSLDAVAHAGDTTIGIQAKRYSASNKVGRPELEQYTGVLHNRSELDELVVVTTSQFTAGAENEGLKSGVEMVDGPELVAKIRDSGLLEDSGHEPGSYRPAEHKPARHNTELRGRLTAVTTTTLGLVVVAPVGMYFQVEMVSAIGMILGAMGSPIAIGMDAITLRRYDANYKPTLWWAPAALFTMGFVGVWYFVRRVTRTDVRAAYDL